MLSFAKGTKKENAKEGVEGMVVDEVLSVVVVVGPSRDVEWLGDSRASRHVCNDVSILWDVRVREDTIMRR